MRSHLLLGALAGRALSQVAEWGQCGGIGYTGSTSCASPYVCCVLNSYYYQCLPSASCSSGTTTAPTSTATTLTTSTKTTTSSSTATTTSSSSGKFKWFGVDESGAEFGSGVIPGVWGTNFIFPSTSTLSTLMSQGFNIFRIPFLMERMVPNTLTGSLDAAYLANYTAVVNYITSNGGYAIVDPHNFGRYYSSIITDTAGFQTFWKTLAAQYASNSKVIFDTNNEYNTEDQTLVLNMNQAAINGIRAAGATSQYIFVEGNAWSGAWSWNTTNTNMVALTDPQNKIIYEMHQYLDSDSSGTSDQCVSTTIGVERLVGATAWLRSNGKLGFLGEFAGGANSVCQTAIQGMLDHMKANSDVWLGGCWWGGGPWWGNYIFSFEPPSGTGYTYYDSLLKSYVP